MLRVCVCVHACIPAGAYQLAHLPACKLQRHQLVYLLSWVLLCGQRHHITSACERSVGQNHTPCVPHGPWATWQLVVVAVWFFGSCSIFIPGRPAGPPVARPATNPWAPGLESAKGSCPARAEPTAARVWPKLVSCKSLSECCEARPGRRPERAPARVGGGLVLELRECQGE